MSARLGMVGMTVVMGMTLGGVGCSGLPSDDELVQQTAAAALAVAEEENASAVAEGALGAMGDVELSEGAGEVVTAEVDREAGTWDPCDFSGLRERIRQAYDANGDGRLDRRELGALRADIGDRVQNRCGGRMLEATRHFRHFALRRVRWAFDVDGDGTLSLEERTALVDALENRCRVMRQRALERWDADQNGSLDEDERAAARAAFRERLEARRAEILANFDANGNGVLDPEERQALREARLQRLRERREEIRTQFDANGNGVLDPEEIDALKQAIRERVALASEGS